MTVEQWPSAKLCGVVQGMELLNFRRGCHLYSAGRPSHWALAHILVVSDFEKDNLNLIKTESVHCMSLKIVLFPG